MSLRTFSWMGALALLAACSGSKGSSSSTPGATSAGVPWVTERAQGGDAVERAVAQRATGAQAGTVRSVEDQFIVLDPYESWAGEARIAISGETAVFRGDERVKERAKDAVRPGQDVNVYYGERNGGPIAMGVKILSREEAQQLRSAISRRSREDADASSRQASSSRRSWEDREREQERESDASSTGVFGPRGRQDRARDEERGFEAERSQAGRISSLSGDELVLDPYEDSAGDARLRIGPDVEVRRRGERVGREALRRGDDVRVFFEPGDRGSRGWVGGPARARSSGEEPRVVGIEILDDEEADRVREEAR